MLITFGGVGTAGSGSIGGVTYSRNRGGAYARARVIPVNPGTPFQSAVRGLLAQLTSLWQTALTAVQREAWDTYALNVPLPGPLGEPRNVGGLGMYIRSNVGRLQALMPRVDTAPVIQNLGDYTPPSVISVTAAGPLISIGFEPLDDWANEDDAAMLLYTSRGRPPTTNYFKGPYRFAGKIDGDAITPETSPFALVGAFSVAVGNKTFIRAVVTRADGRLSADFRAEGVAV